MENNTLTISPTAITDFNRSKAQLQAFWLFAMFVTGKNSDYAARCLAKVLAKCVDKTPFEYLKELGPIGVHNLLVANRVGQYTRLCKGIEQSLELDLETATLEQLMAVHGVGPKTARFFLVHSRPNCNCAILDTHVLQWMGNLGVIGLPQNTPQGDAYLPWEKLCLRLMASHFPQMSVAQADLLIWSQMSGRLE